MPTRIKLTPAGPEQQPAATWQEGLFGGPCAQSTLQQRPLLPEADSDVREAARQRAAAKRSHAKRVAGWFEQEGESA